MVYSECYYLYFTMYGLFIISSYWHKLNSMKFQNYVYTWWREVVSQTIKLVDNLNEINTKPLLMQQIASFCKQYTRTVIRHNSIHFVHNKQQRNWSALLFRQIMTDIVYKLVDIVPKIPYLVFRFYKRKTLLDARPKPHESADYGQIWYNPQIIGIINFFSNLQIII